MPVAGATGEGVGGGQAPPLLIATRFGLEIQDPAWFEHRLALMRAITVPSLLAQRDRRFEWVVFVDSGIPPDARRALEEMLGSFSRRASVVTHPYESDTLLALAEERGLVDARGYVLLGGADDDDGWHPEMVGAVRERVGGWLEESPRNPGLGLSLETGLTWVMHDMVSAAVPKSGELDRKLSYRAAIYRTSSSFLTGNTFICAKRADGITPLSVAHLALPKFLADVGFQVDSIATREPMWLYCRHRQSTAAPLVEGARMPKADIGVDDLVRTFCLDRVQLEDYLHSGERYGHSRAKWAFTRRRAAGLALAEIGREMADPAGLGTAEMARLRQEQSMLEEEMARLTARVVGDVGQAGFEHLDAGCRERLRGALERHARKGAR